MTVHVFPAADGFARRAFTVAEFERMGELGILAEDEETVAADQLLAAEGLDLGGVRFRLTDLG